MSIAEPMSSEETRQTELWDVTPARRIADSCIGCKVSFRGIGLNRAFDDDQKQEIADKFETAVEEIHGGVKLFKKGDLKGVNSAKRKIVDLWRANTLPYHEGGVRLLIVAKAQQFQYDAATLQEGFYDAVQELQSQMPSILARRRQELKRAFNPNHYPSDVTSCYQVMVTYPDLRTPDYLRQINPEVYRLEMSRFQAAMERSVELAEADFTAQMSEMLESLVKALEGTATGDRKCFRTATVNRVFDTLKDFRERLAPFQIGMGQKIEECVNQLESIVANHDQASLAGTLRNSERVRERMTQRFSELASTVSQLSETHVVARRRLLA